MQAIINGFETIINGITTFWSLIANLFKAIGQAFIYIEKVETQVFLFISTIPTWISGFMMATMIIAILYIIIGRVGGHN